MSKTFHEILAEKDDEYTYRIHSTANIHNPEHCEKIKLSLLPYEIKSFDCEGYKPLSKTNPMFPGEPNSPTYTIKVVLRYPLTKRFEQTLAMDAHIHVAHLKITPDADVEPVNGPNETDHDDAQKTAGTKRLGEFVKELQKGREDREDMTWTREVYEAFFTTHRALEVALKKPFLKGYYVVEVLREVDDGRSLCIKGPYANRYEDFPYHDRLRVKASKIISESSSDGLYEVNVLLEGKATK